MTGAFGLVLVAMLFLGAGLAGWSTQRTLEILGWVDHTRQVRFEMERMMFSTVSAEGAMRGFLLTRDETFRARIEQSLTEAEEAYRSLIALTRGDPDQQIRLEQFHERLRERAAAIRELTGVDAPHPTPEEAQIATRLGKERLDELRLIVDEMEKVEDRLLEQRSAAARTASSETGIIVAIGTAVAVLLVLSSAWIIWRDIKARRRGARALLEARNYANSIVDTVRDALVVLDSNLRVARANRSFFEMFKCTPEAVEGRPLAEIGEGAWNEEILNRHLSGLLQSGMEFRDTELEKKFPKLGARIMSVSGRRMHYGPLGSEAVLLSIEDITEMKHAERQVIDLNGELRRRATMLEAANVELEAFSYSVSHDLRAPLRHIDGFADMLRKHTADTLDEKGDRFLRTISEAAKRMGTLIDDLLLFSRMGRAEMKQSAVDLDQLVDEALVEAGGNLEGRIVEWKRSPLPTVDADRALLRQVFVNLFSNALKYSRTREISIIEIGTTTGEPDEVVVYVKDNGVGFDMAYAAKLFGVFQRLHRANEFEGTGIGLANVRRIISRHGGRTWAEGRVGEGATFYFSLPAKATSPAAPAEATGSE